MVEKSDEFTMMDKKMLFKYLDGVGKGILEGLKMRQVEGEWIDYVSGANWATCSVCGKSNKILKRWKYCPECGTEMKGIKEKTWK